MQDFRKIKVWEKAHALTLEIYEVTRTFPKDELFGLTSQMRRCASSIGSNLAEGCGAWRPSRVGTVREHIYGLGQ